MCDSKTRSCFYVQFCTVTLFRQYFQMGDGPVTVTETMCTVQFVVTPAILDTNFTEVPLWNAENHKRGAAPFRRVVVCATVYDAA